MDDIRLPTNRSFGTLFIVVFALFAAWQFWHGGTWGFMWLGASGLVAAVTLVAPDLLTPFSRAWMRLAFWLNIIASPVVLGVIFFLVITPFAVVMRAAGRDLMNRTLDLEASSYWIERDPPGPLPETLRQQF